MFILVTGIIAARAQSSYTTIQYNDKIRPALVVELPNSTTDAEGTILTSTNAYAKFIPIPNRKLFLI